ncbi:MAG TPA: CbtA family protein [Devosia sp.]|nr:CbtA family protein [Devosia sp.]
MKLFQRIFFAAVLAGLAVGLAYAALQQWKVTPLILAAEVFETAAPAEAVAEHVHDAATPAHDHDEDAWAPQDGAERTFYTVLADVLASMGFALLLAAVSVLGGIEITARNGILFGLGGFISMQLAPALGLPPELPGMAAADLGARQIWWVATAVATGAGIFIIAKWQNWTAIGIGAVLMVLPHIIGAPVAPDEPSAVPAHLATSFAASAFAASALFWLTVGPLLGWLNQRFAGASAAAPKGVHA